MQKRNILLWASYDFANSIAVAAFLLYFSQWLVVEHGVSDIWYNLIFVVSSVLLLLTAPITSLAADRRAVKMPFLRLMTLGELGFLLLAGILAAYFTPTPLVLALAAGCFLLSNYFHQFAVIFYNALLPSITGGKAQGWVSGIGLCANFLGVVVGMAFAVLLIKGYLPGLGGVGRTQIFVPATIISALLIIPSLCMKEPRDPMPAPAAAKLEFKASFKSFVELCRHPGVGSYLLGYFLFNDAIITVQDNMPIYMEQVLGVPDTTKSLILGIGLGAAAFGALLAGWVSDKVGLKQTLLALLAGWILFLPMLGLVRKTSHFTGLMLIMGTIFGMTLSINRAIMAYLAPADRRSYAFSYYTIAERFSTFVGPLIWGGITTILYDLGAVRYRIALVAMAAFVLSGLLVIRKIPADRQTMPVVEETAPSEA